jgi:NADH:ubiquinone oxidoreductase subunit C
MLSYFGRWSNLLGCYMPATVVHYWQKKTFQTVYHVFSQKTRAHRRIIVR